MSNTPSQSSNQLADMDRQLVAMGAAGDPTVGEDATSAIATGEFPELGDIGDDDILVDGGTQTMGRTLSDLADDDDDAGTLVIDREEFNSASAQLAAKPALESPPSLKSAKPASLPPPVPSAKPAPAAPELSALDALAASVPVKAKPTPPPPAVDPKTTTSKIVPPAPHTTRITELEADDLEDEQRRVEATQPFKRSHILAAQATQLSPETSQSSGPTTQRTPSQPLQRATAPVVELTPGPALAVQRPAPAPRPTMPSPSISLAPAPVPQISLAPSLAPTLPASSNIRMPTQLPSVVINDPQPTNRPASIAPLAIDIPAQAAPDATMKLPAIRHTPSIPKDNTPILAAAIGGGVALVAAAVIALVSFSATSDDSSAQASSSKSAPMVAPKPREAQKGSIRSAVIETPETTPQKAAPTPGAPDEDGTPVFSASSLPSADNDSSPRSHHGVSGSAKKAAPAGAAPAKAAPAPAKAAPVAAAPAAAPEPPPPPAPAPTPAPAPAAPKSTVGLIQVPSGLMTVMVDGEYKRPANGYIRVTCGKHRVNAGRGTQSLDVPCGGIASVQ